MDGETSRLIFGIVATIIFGLIGAIYLHGRQRDDKQDLRADKQDEKQSEAKAELAKHIEEDTRSHAEHGERLARLEERSQTHDVEIRKLRDMRHEINNETAHTVMENYKDMLDRLNQLREWVNSTFRGGK
jgi:uncharacterized protein HemX